MNTVSALNIYLSNYRQYLLIILNIVLLIFIILEIMIWNKISGFMTEEEYQQLKQELCESYENKDSFEEYLESYINALLEKRIPLREKRELLKFAFNPVELCVFSIIDREDNSISMLLSNNEPFL